MEVDINEEYFEWMYQEVDGKGKRKLLERLDSIRFYAIHPLDENRVFDGLAVRKKFCEYANVPESVMNIKMEGVECSVLEMMFGLAIRAEDTIMADEDYGDRASMWFWIMVKSLGLYEMTDDKYDYDYVDHTVARFLERDYEPDGKGGLFTIANFNKDMRDIDIWMQMSHFFTSIM